MATTPQSSPQADSESNSQPNSQLAEKKGKSVVLIRGGPRNSVTWGQKQIQRLKLDVEFDENGQAIGKNGDKYKSYIGVLARTKVPIDINKWKDVGEDCKLKIWEDVLTVFNIPQSKKKQVISLANIRWSNFKSTLTSLYVYKKELKKSKLPVDDDPLKKYPYIKAEVWKKFKETCLSKDFEEKSKEAVRIQKLNIYPHRMSRGGYSKTKVKLEAKLRASIALFGDKSDNSAISIERGDLWIEGRVNKEGECLNPATKKVIDKIHTMRDEASTGNSTPTGKDDVLSRALGTNEHYGRVRGVGGGVGHKQYFGKTTHHRTGRISQGDIDMLTQMITEKVRAETVKEMESLFERRISTLGNQSVRQIEGVRVDDEVEMQCTSGKASCQDEQPVCQDEQPDNPFAEISDAGAECQLALKDPEFRNVALARVFKPPNHASRSHCLAFKDNEVRVSIEVILEGEDDTPLPVPDKEFSTISKAIGSFVRWPKNLVTFGNPKLCTVQKSKGMDSNKSKKIDSGKTKTKESVAGSTRCLKTLLDKNSGSQRLLSKVASVMQDGQSSPLPLSKNIMGYEQTIFITKEDISQLLNMQQLNISCIQTFIGSLYDLCDTERYGFLCPQYTSLIGHNADESSVYVSDTMIAQKKLLYLAPYYQGKHWMLAVVDIVDNNYIYWLDPVGGPEPATLKTCLNTSVRVYGYGGGKRKSSKTSQWIQIDSARQPGISECGYYVMRYMLEIVARSIHTRFIHEQFQDTTSYSQEEIDEVRDLWANFYLNV